jgi:hypothetical protein
LAKWVWVRGFTGGVTGSGVHLVQPIKAIKPIIIKLKAILFMIKKIKVKVQVPYIKCLLVSSYQYLAKILNLHIAPLTASPGAAVWNWKCVAPAPGPLT